MIVVIDGYNLLKAIFPKEKGRLNNHRDQLIRQLGFYKKQRIDEKSSESRGTGTIKDIVIVFDGGRIGRATREIRNGVVVVFSGQKQSADDWIIDYVERNKNRELMLVTRDRELIGKCQRYGVEVLKVLDFYDIMRNRLLEGVGEDIQKSSDDTVRKYEQNFEDDSEEVEEIDSESLDLLMEQASNFKEKDESIEDLLNGSLQVDLIHKKKGEARKKSKKEKKRLSRLKKL